jgi:integrase
MASLQARHSRACALGDTYRAADHVDGCTCKPTLFVFVRQDGETHKHRAGKNRKVADRLLTKFQHQEDEGEYEPQKNIRFREWGDAWLKALERKETTRESYRSTVAWAKQAFGGKLVRQLRPEDVSRMNLLMRDAKLSDSTRAKHLRVLHACLASAIEHGYAVKNPVSKLPKSEKPRASSKEAAYFTNDELPRLFAAFGEGIHRTLCLVALKTGMRQGELLAVTWGDVKLAERLIHVRRTISKGNVSETKNRQNRKVHLAVEVVELMGQWWGECGKPDDSALVFPGEAGGYLSATSVLGHIRAAMKAAAIPRVGPTGENRTFHSLRHTFAKRALESGRSITWLSRHLGHKTTAITTDTYGHWEAEAAKQEAESMAGVFGV